MMYNDFVIEHMTTTADTDRNGSKSMMFLLYLDTVTVEEYPIKLL